MPLLSQVQPMRIQRLNQRNFLRPAPPLQLLLPPNRLVHVIIRLPINQSFRAVAGCEAFPVMKPMLKSTSAQVSSHPDVQSSRQAPHDVNAIAFSLHQNSSGAIRDASTRFPLRRSEEESSLSMTICSLRLRNAVTAITKNADGRPKPTPCHAERSQTVRSRTV